MKLSAIQKSKKIHYALVERWKELEKKHVDIINDAKERGISIRVASMTDYVRRQKGLSEEQLIYLCFRWGVIVKIQVGKPVLKRGKAQIDDEGNVIHKVHPYDEEECLKNLEKLGFGK